MIVPVRPQPKPESMIVQVDRDAFLRLLKKEQRPLVLHVHAGFPKQHKYLVRHGGYVFMYRSKKPQDFSRESEMLNVEKVHTGLPGLGL